MMPADFIEEYLADLDLRRLSKTSIDRHRRVLARWQQYLEDTGGVSLGEATPRRVLAYVDERLAGGLRDVSVRSELCVLRSFYRRLALLCLVVPEPTAAVPSLICRPPAEKRFLSVEECFSLLEAAEGHDRVSRRNYTLVALLWSTGLRASELRDLVWKDLDLDRETLVVRRGKGRKQRQLFLNERLLEDLMTWKRDLGGEAEDPVFPALNGRGRDGSQRKLGASRLAAIVRQLGSVARIEKQVTPMTLRHTFATHMYDAGATIADLKELLGHDHDTESTVYVHVSLAAARALLEDQIASSPQEPTRSGGPS